MFETIGFKKDDANEIWYGVEHGIYFLIKNSVVDSTPVYELSSEYNCSGLLGSILDFVEAEKRESENFINSYSITSEKLVINFEKNTESENESTEKIEKFVLTLVEKLQPLEIKNTCVHCGRENNLCFYKHSKGISIMCETCGENLKNKIIVEQNGKNNYFRGFLGSLVGSLIGSAVWIILGAVGWVASFAGYAIAFCALMGYKKMKGKLNKTGVIINIVTIVVAFLLANYIGLFIEFYKEYACSFVEFLIMTPVLFSIKEVLFAMLKELSIGALFLVLGMSSTIKRSFGEAKIKYDMKVEKLDFDYPSASAVLITEEKSEDSEIKLENETESSHGE